MNDFERDRRISDLEKRVTINEELSRHTANLVIQLKIGPRQLTKIIEDILEIIEKKPQSSKGD